ncbi:endonuclease NucS [Candidatus Bathyarchaeota archaeon]|nr:MAG: endonuclease NucS [Candidatus Bathyarchaeota archaeon]
MGKEVLSEETIEVLRNPPLQDAARTITDGLRSHRTLLIIGNCRVDYQGRASSKLKPGDRMVIIKRDGSVLVHRPTGYDPVNWQPPGCKLQAYTEKGNLIVRAVRERPRETITIQFNKLYLLTSMALIDRGEFSLYASEEDMQRAVLLHPDLIEEGFKPITYEKKVEPGFIDVYGMDRDGRLVIVEIKRGTAGREAVLQLAKYIGSVKGEVNREVRGILAAPQLAKGAQKMLITLGLEYKRLDPKRCAELLRRSSVRKISEFL